MTAPGNINYTFFDTEPEGKYVLGLGYAPGGLPKPARPAVVSHFSPTVWDAAAVSRYWENLGFPAFPMQRATDGRYYGAPLSLAFDVGYQRHTQFRYKWISPPPGPPNIYADFLNKRGREGIQHIGLPIDDLDQVHRLAQCHSAAAQQLDRLPRRGLQRPKLALDVVQEVHRRRGVRRQQLAPASRGPHRRRAARVPGSTKTFACCRPSTPRNIRLASRA